MMSSMKWLIGSLSFALMIVIFIYIVTMQNATHKTTAELELLADNVSVGMLRGDSEEDGTLNIKHFNKDELIANLVAEVVSVQKNNNFNIEIDYVFYGEDNEVVTEEDDIRSLQFRIQHVNKKGNVQGSAERRLTINQLGE